MSAMTPPWVAKASSSTAALSISGVGAGGIGILPMDWPMDLCNMKPAPVICVSRNSALHAGRAVQRNFGSSCATPW